MFRLHKIVKFTVVVPALVLLFVWQQLKQTVVKMQEMTNSKKKKRNIFLKCPTDDLLTESQNCYANYRPWLHSKKRL